MCIPLTIRHWLPPFAVAVATMLLNVGNADAHGTLDQALAGDANCGVFDHPASVTQAGGQRQEFVPSQAGLVAVSVCIQAPSGPTEVDVVIRTGSANAPGSTIGGGSVVADESPGYVHVDFVATIPVTPGTKYVIELATANGLEVTWRGSEFDQDLYQAGTSSHAGVVRDFAFRTYGGALPVTPTTAATKSPTPTRTPTPVATVPLAPTSTPPPVPTLPPPTPSLPPTAAVVVNPTVAAAGSSSGGAGAARAQAITTRASGVLGGVRRVGTIKPPDVGDGASRTSHRTTLITAVIVLVTVGAVGAALRLRRSP